MKPTVGLFDYGSGNLHSAAQALGNAGAEVIVTGDLAQLRQTAGLVVPGVGAFAACMAGLKQAGGDVFIQEWVAAERPLLGICVGHQILFSTGTEHGIETAGVGIFDGAVAQLGAKRLPHMGWNTVEVPDGSVLFQGIEQERFYFVHSYGVAHGPQTALTTYSEHEQARFVAAVEQGRLCSTQFHPEKSGAAGAQLLKNWLNMLG